MTANEVNGKAMFKFSRVFSQLDELKALFEEKVKPSSSKKGKSKIVDITTTEEKSKSPSTRRSQSSVQSPQKPNEEDIMSSDHSHDSLATRQKKGIGELPNWMKISSILKESTQPLMNR